MRRPRQSGSRGLALVAVLWVTALLAVLAASLASGSRTEALVARNRIEIAKAEALADGGIHRAVEGLLDGGSGTAWRADGTVYRFALGEGRISVAIEDEDGKIDLNAAPPALLASLLTAVGLDDDQAQTLADRILDFRDEDDRPSPLGAEDPDYRSAGLGAGAADRPFLDPVELLGVLGMTQTLYARILPHVTVYSGAEGVDPAVADDAVLASLPAMTPEIMAAIRSAAPGEDLYTLIPEPALVEMETYLLPSREVVYTLRALAETAGGGRFIREALVELSGDPAQPFLVHAWRRGTWFPPRAAAAPDRIEG